MDGAPERDRLAAGTDPAVDRLRLSRLLDGRSSGRRAGSAISGRSGSGSGSPCPSPSTTRSGARCRPRSWRASPSTRDLQRLRGDRHVRLAGHRVRLLAVLAAVRDGGAARAQCLLTAWWRALHPAREKELTDRVDELTRTRRGALDVAGRGAAPDRARSARRRAGTAGGVEHAARPRRGPARGASGGRRAGAQRARRGVQRDQGAARPRARHRAAGALRPRPAGRRRVAGGAQRAAREGGRAGRSPALPGRRVRRLLRRRRGADQRGQARPRGVREGVAVRRGRAADRRGRRQRPGRRATPTAAGSAGLRNRVEALDGILVVLSNPGEGTTVHAELPCE